MPTLSVLNSPAKQYWKIPIIYLIQDRYYVIVYILSQFYLYLRLIWLKNWRKSGYKDQCHFFIFHKDQCHFLFFIKINVNFLLLETEQNDEKIYSIFPYISFMTYYSDFLYIRHLLRWRIFMRRGYFYWILLIKPYF